MKMKPFSEKTPRNRLLLVYFSDCGYRIATYSKLGCIYVWRLQGTGRHNEIIGDWHETKDTFWCELPEVPGVLIA